MTKPTLPQNITPLNSSSVIAHDGYSPVQKGYKPGTLGEMVHQPQIAQGGYQPLKTSTPSTPVKPPVKK
jgi:hypothetical protein